jgi:hypothetical protein
VLGAGRPVVNRPPVAVTSRPVVALRTPAPMPRSFDQRQAQAGGHLNQQTESLVRQEPPGRPVPNKAPRQPQSPDGFRSFAPANSGSNQTKPQPRVWEAQGTPEPEKSASEQPGNQNAQTAGGGGRAPGQGQAAQQWSHPLAKPVAPVQERSEQQQKDQEKKFSTWQQQKPASPPPQKQQSSPPPPRQEPAPKKGH